MPSLPPPRPRRARRTSVHVDLTADGTVTIDVLGTGVGTPIDLSDTTAAADFDLQSAETRATFSAPGPARARRRGDRGRRDGLREDHADRRQVPSHAGRGVTRDAARRPDRSARHSTGLDPVKGADVAVCRRHVLHGRAPAHRRRLRRRCSAADLQLPAGLPIPIPDLSDATVDLTLQIEQATTRLSGITAEVASRRAGRSDAPGDVLEVERARLRSAPRPPTRSSPPRKAAAGPPTLELRGEPTHPPARRATRPLDDAPRRPARSRPS